MRRPSRRSPFHRALRATMLIAVSMVALQGLDRGALAASPYQRTYLACSNGERGDDGECKRLCRSFLNQKNNPLGDMRGTCLRRLDSKRNVLTDPD